MPRLTNREKKEINRMRREAEKVFAVSPFEKAKQELIDAFYPANLSARQSKPIRNFLKLLFQKGGLFAGPTIHAPVQTRPV